MQLKNDVSGKMENEYSLDQSIISTHGIYVVNILTTNNSINKKVIVAKYAGFLLSLKS